MTEGEFRSQNALPRPTRSPPSTAAEIPLEKPGKVAILAVTNVGGQQFGAATGITVQKEDPVVSRR